MISVILDTRDQLMIRGVISSHQPPTNGIAEGDHGFTDQHAWNSVYALPGVAMEQHRSATRVWNSMNWLLGRSSGPKELLWILSGIDVEGAHRTFVVRVENGQVVFDSGGHNHFDVMPISVEAYARNGSVYWESITEDGCYDLDNQCTDPAFSASLTARSEVSWLVESWKNMSLSSGSVYGFEWPWTGQLETPLRSSVREIAPFAPASRLFVVVAHSGQECTSPTNPSGVTPCSNYQRMWIGDGDDSMDVYGHEFGHSIFQDLKVGGGHPVFSESGSFVEFVADWAGIVSEDLRLRWLYPTGPSNRTNFRIQTANSIVDWPTGGCNLVNPQSKRLALGKGMHLGWNSLLLQPQPRDVLFRAWRLTSQYALFLSPRSFPVGRDFVAALVAMTPPEPINTAPYPQPSAVLGAGMLSLGCF